MYVRYMTCTVHVWYMYGTCTCTVVALVSLSKTLNHNCFVLRMGRKAVGPVCCVMHVKEHKTLIVKEKGLPRCFWIRALSTQQGGYVRTTNLLYITSVGMSLVLVQLHVVLVLDTVSSYTCTCSLNSVNKSFKSIWNQV